VGRETIKLTHERHGNGIRYKRMVKGNTFKSTIFSHDNRDHKREAWQQFLVWREQQSAIASIAPQQDQYGLIRQMLTSKVTALVEHAEFTDDQIELKTFRKLLIAIPNMERDDLFKLTALTVGEVAGQHFREVIADRELTVSRVKRQANTDLTARKLADEYIDRLQRKAEAGRGSWGHHGQVKRALDLFADWYGASRSLESLNEKNVREFNQFLETKIDVGDLSRNSAHNYQAKVRTWLGQLVEDHPDEIPLPKNLRSRSQLIPGERTEPDPFTIDEIKLLLSNASPRTKLFLLLMLNCGMYQSDIADLTADQIDWTTGRIIRPRSKTSHQAQTTGRGSPYRFNWLLWRDTWELYQNLAKREGICFLTEKGSKLIIHKPTARTDIIRSAYTRLIKTLKRRQLLGTSWNKTLKQLRKTPANLLEKSEQHGAAYQLYLNHSVAKQHYLASGQVVPSFDAAVLWVGTQFGVS
jgi:integrase